MNGFPFSCTDVQSTHGSTHLRQRVKSPLKTILNLIRRTSVVLVPTHNACWVPSLHHSVLNEPIHPEVSNQSQVYALFCLFFNAPRSKVTITRVPVWSIWRFQSFPFLLSPPLCFLTNLPLPTHPSLLLHLPIANALQWLGQWEDDTQKSLVLEIPGPWDTSGQRSKCLILEP